MVANLADLEKLNPKPATLFFSMEPARPHPQFKNWWY